MPNTHTTLTSLFTDIADAIRSKTGSSTQIVADDFPTEISNLTIGTDTSDATLNDASQLLSGITAYSNGQKFSGTGVQHGVYCSNISVTSNSQKTISFSPGFVLGNNCYVLILLTSAINPIIGVGGVTFAFGASYQNSIGKVHGAMGQSGDVQYVDQNISFNGLDSNTVSVTTAWFFPRGTYTVIAYN